MGKLWHDIKLSFVIPAYNEADSFNLLSQCFDEINTALQSKDAVKDWELILVDDGSDDSSRKERRS